MPVDRNYWTHLSFTKTHPPELKCPSCAFGGLQLDKKSLYHGSDQRSHKEQEHPDWEIEWWSGRFSCLFHCTNKSCCETVAATGKACMEYDEKLNFVPLFEPLHFNLPLLLIEIPSVCPSDVSDELHLAFALFFTDLAGGLNHLRKAVELILNHLKVRRKKLVKKGTKFAPLTLHQRIETFRAKNPQLADRLEAIKWIGNVGSHDPKVSQASFFDAIDLLEDFIQAHFEKRGKRITSITRKVMQRKGK